MNINLLYYISDFHNRPYLIKCLRNLLKKLLDLVGFIIYSYNARAILFLLVHQDTI